MKIRDQIDNGVEVILQLVDDRLQFTLFHPARGSTTFAISHEATEQLRAELIDYQQLENYAKFVEEHQPMTRSQMRNRRTQMNPLYWQLACMQVKTKEERMALFAQYQNQNLTEEQVLTEINSITSKRKNYGKK